LIYCRNKTQFMRSVARAKSDNIGIPIIDVSVLRDPKSSLESRKKVARQIGDACENVGFIIIVNHGVNPTALNNIWKDTQDFFDLPLEKKVGKDNFLLMSDDFPYGYSPFGGEVLEKGDEGVHGAKTPAGQKAGDMKEMFSCGPYMEGAGVPLPRYPNEPKRMAASWRAYFEEMEKLSQALMRGFALALDVKEDFFVDKTNLHASSIRALNYPRIEGYKPVPGRIRASAHTDYGVLTILRSGGPGLQVKLLDGQWHSAPAVPDSFVINLGDLMSRWTNDKWRSTPHRVINPDTADQESELNKRRQSIAYFCNLNMDAHVEAIPTCVSKEKPSKYPPTLAGEHLMNKHYASTRGILDDSWMKDITK
jgi:isopenicillin N synthase-like dioxygenase